MREYSKKAGQPNIYEAAATPPTAVSANVPNSAMMAMYGYSEATDTGLDDKMRERMNSAFKYRDKQIPAAEQEADQIASLIKGASTPDEVKSALGEQMGADFSDVRFHTGALAAQNADGIGARAYTTGLDVYFGEGGFDPGVAAHELVHTAQQGAVQSGAPTVAAPMGGVQMKPKDEKSAEEQRRAIAQAKDPNHDAAAEEKGFWGGFGRRIASPFVALGRILRPDKPIKALTRKMGIASSVGMDDAAMRLAAETSTDTSDMGDAARYKSDPETSKLQGFKSSALPTILPLLAGVTLDTGVNTVASKLTKSNEYGGLRDLAEGKMVKGTGTTFGAFGGGLSAVSGVMGTVQNAAKVNTSRRGGNTADAVQASLQTVQSMGSIASGVANTMGYAGVAPGLIANGILPGINIVSGEVQATKGAFGAASGIATQMRMTKQLDKLKADKEAAPGKQMGLSEKQRLSLMRSMHMAREMGAINKEAGFGQVVAGKLTSAGGITTLSGVGALPGTILSGVGTGVNVLSGLNKTVQVEDMRRRVVDQELGMAERMQKLDKELASRGESQKYDKETKERIILQRMGFNSGSKTEAFMNIAMNRSKMMTDMSNSSTHKDNVKRVDDPKAKNSENRLHGEAKYNWDGKDDELKKYRQRKFARETLKGMGLSKVKLDGDKRGYSQQGVAEKLGMEAGVDINHQLAKSREGTSSQEALAKEQIETADKIMKLQKKKENASFGWTRKRYDEKLKEQEQRMATLSHGPSVQARPAPTPAPAPRPGRVSANGAMPPPLLDDIVRQRSLLRPL